LILIVSYAALFAIFILTWIDSRLAGRFLWYVPLVLVPVFLRVVSQRRLATAFLLVVFLAVPLGRNVKWAGKGLVSRLPVTQVLASEEEIRSIYYLTAMYPVRCPEGAIQVVPPCYPWMRRWGHSDLPETERASVRILRR
jgi:hypothetical protein